MAQTTRKSYKHSTPFDSGFLRVDSIHDIHYEQYGNKDGKPIVFVHGGPGGSSSSKNTIFFNPSVYRVILFDQRGCGQSTPLGEIRENSPQHSASDMELLRKQFGIQRWHVFGASWGTTLSLIYAQTYPEAVVSLTLRGVSFFEAEEKIDFNAAFQRTKLFRPELYDKLVEPLNQEERENIAGSYAKRFSCGDHAIELAAMKIYDRWAGGSTKLVPNEDDSEFTMTEEEEKRMVASIRIEWHYHAHNLWLKELRYLEPEKLENIKDIPCYIVNGRYDLICPPIAAWRLHKLLPNSKIFIVPDAGHSATEPGTQNKLVEICDEIASFPI
ncbi:proline iminopeptidase [Penicillium verhagenii]|nr:proline iminopeptidase [Penicillium verhagenii]